MDEGRWLRPNIRSGWQNWLLQSASMAFALSGSVALQHYRHPETSIRPLAMAYLALFILGGPPLLAAGHLVDYFINRAYAWEVGPAGVVIWRRGVVIHTYPWSKILKVDWIPWGHLRISTLDGWRDQSLRVLSRDDVRWFREYARDRVVLRPAATNREV